MASLKVATPASNGTKKTQKATKKSAGSTKKRASGRSKPTVKSAAGSKRPLTDREIGAVAGDVWAALADDGPMSLTALKKSVGAPESHIMAAIGWLARENKLLFSNQGRTTRLSLQ